MVYKRYAEDQLDNIQGIIKFASGNEDLLGFHAGVAWGLNKYQIAYILATAEHESGFRPIKEIGGTQRRYAPYYGRGYVQLTHKENYEKYGRLLHLDLVHQPDLALREDVARVVLVHGMTHGWFTGKKLSDYISDFDHCDYIGARWIINLQDQAQHIADLANFWQGALSGINGIGSDPAPRL
ncbi:hypothetical protein BGX26_003706 [Mortierella sp. AD094]|nr:hypothetical protein BGX26_003706 [Mortierella sp. AD094]